MIVQVNYIKSSYEYLEAVDDEVAEEDLVIILISSLPEKYKFLITVLETIGEDKQMWDYVSDRLIHEFDKMHGASSKIRISDTRQDALLSNKSEEQKKADT